MSKDEKYTFLMEEESSGIRIDRVLSLLLEESSRSYIQKLIEKGNVTVDGHVCTSKIQAVCRTAGGADYAGAAGPFSGTGGYSAGYRL